MSEMVNLKVIEVRGQMVQIQVTPVGYFYAVAEGKSASDYEARLAGGEKLEEVEAAVKRVLMGKREEVKVPFSQVIGYRVRPGVARAISQKGGILVTYLDSNEKDEVKSYAETMRRLTAEEAAPLNALGERVLEKQKELRQLVQEFETAVRPFKRSARRTREGAPVPAERLTLDEAVRAAIEERVSERLAREEALAQAAPPKKEAAAE